ncbi:MAG: hypothetical protein LBD80_04375, partial [Tannerella sp.]|nr:hypothetical protein [Tannerella sp.]
MLKIDFIPRADNLFLAWLKTLFAYVQSKQDAWSIPPASINELQTLTTNFGNALAVTENPATRTKVTVQVKNDAHKAVESKTRLFLKAYVTYNPAVTNPDRDAMNLPIHKTKRSDVPVPTTTVEAEVSLPSPGVIEISFHDAASGRRAKPDGVHGAEMAWSILNTPPVTWKELTHSSF